MTRVANINNVHPYPCKYPAEAITSFLYQPEETILDPFCGSGTTLYNAARFGWCHVIGFDSNPIASLITNFKLLQVDHNFFSEANEILAALNSSGLNMPSFEYEFNGHTHWFDDSTLIEIGRVRNLIEDQQRIETRLWLQISLSRIVNRFSRQESETRYVAVDKPFIKGQFFSHFHESCAQTLRALKSREPFESAKLTFKTINVIEGFPLSNCSVDRIVTSPPYANTMDYYLYHKQRMNILGFDFKKAQALEIGSRHEFSSLKASAFKWEHDYGLFLAECMRVLKPGKSAIIIIGDSQIAGERIDAAGLTEGLCVTNGFKFSIINSVALTGRSRSFSSGFQRPNKYEHTIRVTKP